MDTIGCKIIGLRQPGVQPTLWKSLEQMDDGVRKINIQGYEFYNSIITLSDYLTNFGGTVSDIKEVLFADGDVPFTKVDGKN
jgi:hypothetical protein